MCRSHFCVWFALFSITLSTLKYFESETIYIVWYETNQKGFDVYLSSAIYDDDNNNRKPTKKQMHWTMHEKKTKKSWPKVLNRDIVYLNGNSIWALSVVIFTTEPYLTVSWGKRNRKIRKIDWNIYGTFLIYESIIISFYFWMVFAVCCANFALNRTNYWVGLICRRHDVVAIDEYFGNFRLLLVFFPICSFRDWSLSSCQWCQPIGGDSKSVTENSSKLVIHEISWKRYFAANFKRRLFFEWK